MVRVILRKLIAAFGAAAPGESGSLVLATRPPGTSDEERVASILARLPVRTRVELVAALADDLRHAEDDPFRSATEVGVWRLSLYHTAAEELVGRLLGDFLAERQPLNVRGTAYPST